MTKKMEEQFVDPMAPAHKRILNQIINDITFEFHWTRALVAELLEVITGKVQHLDESLKEGVNRMLQRAVDSSQLGLLMDLLNSKSNFTLTEKLISGMMPLLTKNETVIGRPVCSSKGDIKEVVIPLSTDGKTDPFTFRSDRTRYDEFNATKHTEEDQATAINGFLSDCLESNDQKLAFNKLDLDERNFSLAVKVFGKVSRFLAQNQAIMTAPTLKKSVK